MSATVQSIFRQHFAAYRQGHTLTPPMRKAARALMQCRREVLGGHVQRCPEGHVEQVWYNSCKHRSCPQCAEIHLECHDRSDLLHVG